MFNWFKKKQEPFPEPRWRIIETSKGFSLQEKRAGEKGFSWWPVEYDRKNNDFIYYKSFLEAQEKIRVFVQPVVVYYYSSGKVYNMGNENGCTCRNA